jgi:tripartite-type tricarboxylate transporter receptor subunit TctC
MQRRQFLTATLSGALLAAPGLTRANTADTPVKIIVGFAPGGGTDVLARLIGNGLSPIWKRPVIVENRPGATGVIAADLVARSPADGTTLLMAHVNSNAIAPYLLDGVKYDPRKDFTALSMVGVTPNMLTCAPTQTVRTVAGVVQACREKPGKISFGSSGIGSAQHLAFEMLKIDAGIDAVHVPYKGSSALLVDLLGGQIDYAFDTMTAATPFVHQGKVIAIAQTRKTRARSFPDLPTLAESGYPTVDAASWYGLVGPKGMPADLVAKMNADINTVLAQPEVRQKLESFGAEDAGGTPQSFQQIIDAENTKWSALIRKAGIKV